MANIKKNAILKKTLILLILKRFECDFMKEQGRIRNPLKDEKVVQRLFEAGALSPRRGI